MAHSGSKKYPSQKAFLSKSQTSVVHQCAMTDKVVGKQIITDDRAPYNVKTTEI